MNTVRYERSQKHRLDDSSLQNLVAETPSQCILSIEDIDCAFPDLRRDEEKDDEPEGPPSQGQEQNTKSEEEEQEEKFVAPKASDVTLSGLLNLIDSVWSEEGRILFATVRGCLISG